MRAIVDSGFMGALPWIACLLAVFTLSAMPSVAQTQDAGGGTATTAFTPPTQSVSSPFPTGSQTQLGMRVAAMLSDPTVAGAHWGIAVTALDGTPIYGLDEGKLFRPASSAKLFTTAAAMAMLGPDSTVTTAIYGNLDSTSGTVTGDLVLVGGGDPSFGTDDLPYRSSAGESAPSAATAALGIQQLTDQLAKEGVRAIAGNVVGDDTLFSAEAPPEGWAEEDLIWGYGALPSALAIGDNQLSLTVTPNVMPVEPPGGTNIGATVGVDQVVPHLRVVTHVITASAEHPQPDRLDLSRPAGDALALEVGGSVTSGHPAVHEHVALADPALYAAQILQMQLLTGGINAKGVPYIYPRVHGTPRPFLATLRSPNSCGQQALGQPVSCAYACGSTPHPTLALATHISPPLSEEIAFTLKTSANLHAEVLLHRLGLKNACPGDTTLDGARMVRTWLLQTGLRDGDFVLYDGSGLSTKDLVTPRAEAQLLAYAARQPWFASWKAALPIGGVDGTLSARFTEAPLKGHVFAKTGTLGESRALAGYVLCASGREVIFSILDDNHTPGSSADRIAMDRVVAAIVASN